MLSSSIVVTTSTNGTCAAMRAVVLRRHVGDRAHQQSAGAAAGGEDLVLRDVALRDEELGRVDEIGEGVFLLEQLAVLVPLPAHFLAAADVRDGVDEPAVDQRERGDEKRGSVDAP